MNTKWYKSFVKNIINFFKYRNTQRPIKIFSLIRQLSKLYCCLYIFYIPYTLLRSTKRLTDLPRGRATEDKSDCSDGIAIRNRLYVYSTYIHISCGILGCTLVISAGSRATRARGWKGLGVGRIHPPQIDWNCSPADISFLVVRGSFR